MTAATSDGQRSVSRGLQASVSLTHPAFQGLAELSFRRAASEVAGQAVYNLNGRQAVLSLPQLGDHIGLPQEHPDRWTLARLTEALRVHPIIRPGDAWPTEMTTGEASWKPEAKHLHIAADRVGLQLALWGADGAIGPDLAGLGPAMLMDPEGRKLLARGIAKAAQLQPVGSREEALMMVGRLGKEMSQIEALRDWLLGGNATIAGGLEKTLARNARDTERREAVRGALNLARSADARHRQEFAKVDKAVADVAAVLERFEPLIGQVRDSRNGLWRAWTEVAPLARAWAEATPGTDLKTFELVARTAHALQRADGPRGGSANPTRAWGTQMTRSLPPAKSNAKGVVW